jgi:hypothetical protein
MIVVSTIKLDADLRIAFEAGAGQKPVYYDGKDYDQIQGFLSHSHLDGPNRLIITGGGLVAFIAARNAITTSKFVSLVGVEPAGNIGNCYGGVTFDSVADNTARVAFLVRKGRAVGNIGLFCNRKSTMNATEVAAWQAIPNVNHTIAYGGNTGNANNATHYLADLNGADAGISTMIVSADPFFQDTKDALIDAANQWVAGAAVGARYVCYPLADFANVQGVHQPTGGTASWYGPSLSDAYQTLGSVASLALNATAPIPFSNLAPTSGDF